MRSLDSWILFFQYINILLDVFPERNIGIRSSKYCFLRCRIEPEKPMPGFSVDISKDMYGSHKSCLERESGVFVREHPFDINVDITIRMIRLKCRQTLGDFGEFLLFRLIDMREHFLESLLVSVVRHNSFCD